LEIKLKHQVDPISSQILLNMQLKLLWLQEN